MTKASVAFLQPRFGVGWKQCNCSVYVVYRCTKPNRNIGQNSPEKMKIFLHSAVINLDKSLGRTHHNAFKYRDQT
jgi:hypothetical protein